MKLFHPSNVYQESWLLLGIMKLLGLYPIQFFRVTCTNYVYVISLIAFYMILCTYVFHNIHDMFVTFSAFNETFIFRQIRYYIGIFLFPIIMISSMRQSTKIRRTFEHIDNVDKNVKFLNTEIDHILCMKNDIVSITAVMFVAIITNLMDYYALSDNDSGFMYNLMWISDRVPDFINVIIICSFTVFVSKIKFRFKYINLMLNIITKGKSYISISETSDVNNAFRYKLLKRLRFELCRTVSLLNEIYGFRFKILTMTYTAYVCLHMCVIYNHTNNELYTVDLILSFVWGTMNLIKLVYLIHLYHSLTLEYT